MGNTYQFEKRRQLWWRSGPGRQNWQPNSAKGQGKIKDETLAQIQQSTTLKTRAVKALKASSAAAFNQAIDHPVAKVVIEGIKGLDDK